MFVNGASRRARSDTSTRSQCASMVNPSPTAAPLTAASSGLGKSWSVSTKAGKPERSGSVPRASSGTVSAISRRAVPAQNALPAPVSTTTPTASSAAAARSASADAWYSASLNAFARSGRSKVMRRARSWSSIRSTASAYGEHHRDEFDGLIADGLPLVVRAVLHDRLAGTDHDRFGVGKRELQLPGDDDVDVDGGGRVPPRLAGVVAGREAHPPERHAPAARLEHPTGLGVAAL